MNQELAEGVLMELLRGRGAHVDPMACVEDLSASLAGRKDPGQLHSIWQILGHVNYWMDYELKRIRGEHPAYPQHAAESWPAESAPRGEAEWRREVERLSLLLDDLAALASSSEDVLRRPVLPTNSLPPDPSRSTLAVLWQTLVHNSYHIGQIALLRRAFGDWPPRRGGDTW